MTQLSFSFDRVVKFNPPKDGEYPVPSWDSIQQIKYANKWKNKDQYCNFCRKETHTKEWDCTVCGFSKGHP